MHTHHLTAPLASEHRSQLLRDAEQYRLAHTGAVTRRGPRPRAFDGRWRAYAVARSLPPRRRWRLPGTHSVPTPDHFG